MQRRLRRRARPPCALRVREYCRQFVAFMFSNVGVIGLVVGYTVAGAFIFQAIEESSEVERVLMMARSRQRTAERLWRQVVVPLNVFDEALWKINVSAALQEYQHTVVRAIRNGWDGSDRSQAFRQWSFPRAFLYSLTVVTTIGYGNISPRTPWGKVTTMVYAMIGMPLFLLYLSNIGNVLARSFKWFYVNVCLCRGCPGVAKRRATRLRMQIQAQLGEPMEALTYPAREEIERRHSEPQWRAAQRCSDYLDSLPYGDPLDDHRFFDQQKRGASEPCTMRRYYTDHRQLRSDETDIMYRRKDVLEQDIYGKERYRDFQDSNYSYNQRRNEKGLHYRENCTERTGIDMTNRRYRHNRKEMDRLERQDKTEMYQRFNENVTRQRKEDEYYDNRSRKMRHKDDSPNERFNNDITNPNRNDRRNNCLRRDVMIYKDAFQKSEYKRDDILFNDFQEEEVRQQERRRQKMQPYKTYRYSDGIESECWQRRNDLEHFGGGSKTRDQFYDPIDNYGKYENQEDETADSDEFTYITIDSQNVTVPITICVIIMVVYIIFGAMLFSMWEDWDRVDGSYFCFISLTSIGFGDIVPGERIYARATRDDDNKRIDTSFILCSIYLLFGMALIAMCFNLMQEQVVQYLAGAKRILRRACRCKR